VHRPAVLPAPAPALRLTVGGFADEGILASQRALPTVLTDAGYRFGASEIDQGLAVALR
jgi:NAD dependent epimerase/dehydratase family enzyme